MAKQLAIITLIFCFVIDAISHTVCPPGTINLNEHCLPVSNDTGNDNTRIVRTNCSGNKVLVNGVCQDSGSMKLVHPDTRYLCPNSYTYTDGICLNINALSLCTQSGNSCLTYDYACQTEDCQRKSCGSEKVYYSGGCASYSLAICPLGTSLRNGACVSEIINQITSVGSNNIKIRCPYGYENVDGTCVHSDSNRINYITAAANTGGIKIICPDGFENLDGTCVDSDSNRINYITAAANAGGIKIICPNGFKNIDGTCVNTNSETVDVITSSVGTGNTKIVCPGGYKIKDGNCVNTNYCSNGYSDEDGTCISNTPCLEESNLDCTSCLDSDTCNECQINQCQQVQPQIIYVQSPPVPQPPAIQPPQVIVIQQPSPSKMESVQPTIIMPSQPVVQPPPVTHLEQKIIRVISPPKNYTNIINLHNVVNSSSTRNIITNINGSNINNINFDVKSLSQNRNTNEQKKESGVVHQEKQCCVIMEPRTCVKFGDKVKCYHKKHHKCGVECVRPEKDTIVYSESLADSHYPIPNESHLDSVPNHSHIYPIPNQPHSYPIPNHPNLNPIPNESNRFPFPSQQHLYPFPSQLNPYLIPSQPKPNSFPNLGLSASYPYPNGGISQYPLCSANNGAWPCISAHSQGITPTNCVYQQQWPFVNCAQNVKIDCDNCGHRQCHTMCYG